MGKVEPQVKLARSTHSAEAAIAAAAKLCYADNTQNILDQNTDDSKTFIRKLLKMGHLSPIEHVGFTFLIEGISRAMTHQLVRHRVASYSQRSQRYVAHDEFDYIVPPSIEGKTVQDESGPVDAAEYYHQTMQIIAQRYGRLNDALGRSGEQSNQDARYVLPNACETKLFVTMNGRELLHFFEERLCLRAQWEIRGVASQMLQLVKENCPAVFDGSGPKCVRLGYCPEGKLTCGQFKQIKQQYAPSDSSK